MGLFGPSKIKVAPNDFLKNQLNKIFSKDLIDAEKEGFQRLSKNIIILRQVKFDKYLIERQNVIYNLFQLAWDQNIPYKIFIKYCSIMLEDQRVKAINSGVYDRCLSKAQDAGMDTFGYISSLFITQILPQNIDTNNPELSNLYVIYGSDFTNYYKYFEGLIKKYKFI